MIVLCSSTTIQFNKLIAQVSTNHKARVSQFQRKNMAGSASAAGSGIMKFLKPSLRPQPTDLQAAVGWGVAGASAALYLIQPWGWIKRTFFEKQEEQN